MRLFILVFCFGTLNRPCFVMEVLNLDMELLLIELERWNLQKEIWNIFMLAYSFFVGFLGF